MFCSNCGKEYEIGQKYCVFCGNKLASDMDEEPVSQPAQENAPEAETGTPAQENVPDAETGTPAPQPEKPRTKKVVTIVVIVGIVLVLLICAVIAFWLLKDPDYHMIPIAEALETEELGTDASDTETEEPLATENAAATENSSDDIADDGSAAETNGQDTDIAPEEDPSATADETESFVSFMMDEKVTYSYDLDGDGSKEDIYFEKYTDYEDYFGCEIFVYVNGVSVIDLYSDYAIGGGVGICDFETDDLYKEIYVTFYSDSDCFDQDSVYRYRSGAADLYYSVTYDEYPVARWSLDLSALGSGTVCYDQEFYTQYLGQGYAHRTFCVNDGKLVQVKSNIYDVTDEWRTQEYHATIELAVLSGPGGEATGETIGVSDCFYLLQLYTQTDEGTLYGDILYVHVLTAGGIDGWIAVPNEEFFEENSWRMWG